jgi:hypothetical protein
MCVIKEFLAACYDVGEHLVNKISKYLASLHATNLKYLSQLGKSAASPALR